MTHKATPDSYLGERFEFKYILTPEQAVRIESDIQKLGLNLDENIPGGEYTVNSVYYETLLLDDYHDKDGSLLRRKKLRARMYHDSWNEPLDNVWFEVKRKNNFHISKIRTQIEGGVWRDFFATGRALPLMDANKDLSGQNPGTLGTFMYYYTHGNYKPHIMVRYRRRAYMSKFVSPVRLTFDKDIQTAPARMGRVEDKRAIPVRYGTTILEVKFERLLPWWFTDIIGKYSIRRTDFSKYSLSVDALRAHYRLPIPR